MRPEFLEDGHDLYVVVEEFEVDDNLEFTEVQHWLGIDIGGEKLWPDLPAGEYLVVRKT
jgi:hypothetical protein